MRTRRKWVAAHVPSRVNGLGRPVRADRPAPGAASEDRSWLSTTGVEGGDSRPVLREAVMGSSPLGQAGSDIPIGV